MTLANDSPPWYLSSTTLTIAGLIVAAIGIVAAVWAAFRSTNPRRRIYFYIAKSVPLLSTHKAVHGDIEIHHQGKILKNPHVVTISLVNRGHRDIPSTSFDGGKPLVAELSTSILRLLETDSDTHGRAVTAPLTQVNGSQLLIGPSLITGRQSTSYTVLVDGEPSFTPEATLVDIPMDGTPPTREGRFSRRTTILLLISILMLIGQLVFSSLTFDTLSDQLALFHREAAQRSKIAIDRAIEARYQLLQEGQEHLQARIEGVQAFEQIMRESPNITQPVVVTTLSGFVSASTPRIPASASNNAPTCPDEPVAADVQAALTALGRRDHVFDGPVHVDLTDACLAKADLTNANLANAELSRTYLANANLTNTNLAAANLTDANFSGATLAGTNLVGAKVTGAIGLPIR